MTHSHILRALLLISGAVILIATSPAEGFYAQEAPTVSGGQTLLVSLSGINDPANVESSIAIGTGEPGRPDAGPLPDMLLIDPVTSEATTRIEGWVSLCASGSSTCEIEVETIGTERGPITVTVAGNVQGGCAPTQPVSLDGVLTVRAF